MTLWNIIRDFFVEYIFGGTLSNYQLVTSNLMGSFAFVNDEGQDLVNANTQTGCLPINMYDVSNEEALLYISLGDWLSTTATIISLCAICVFLFLFVRWLFRLTAGLISGRG